jgi:DNA gyrase/topoisomerase IV subunit A
MTLAQVTKLDASKYAKEQNELQVRIAELQSLLGDRKALISLLKKEMQQLIKQFGDERRTVIDVEGLSNEPVTVVESLHTREPLTIAVTRHNALKALPRCLQRTRVSDCHTSYSFRDTIGQGRAFASFIGTGYSRGDHHDFACDQL